MTTILDWSKIADDNTVADSSCSWFAGMTPKEVVDSGRGFVMRVAEYIDNLGRAWVTKPPTSPDRVNSVRVGDLDLHHKWLGVTPLTEVTIFFRDTIKSDKDAGLNLVVRLTSNGQDIPLNVVRLDRLKLKLSLDNLKVSDWDLVKNRVVTCTYIADPELLGTKSPYFLLSAADIGFKDTSQRRRVITNWDSPFKNKHTPDSSYGVLNDDTFVGVAKCSTWGQGNDKTKGLLTIPPNLIYDENFCIMQMGSDAYGLMPLDLIISTERVGKYEIIDKIVVLKAQGGDLYHYLQLPIYLVKARML